MSTPEGPQKRRRIAGESKPGETRAPVPAKKVVRRPVARPGAPAGRDASPAVDAPSTDPTPARADEEQASAEQADAAVADQDVVEERSGAAAAPRVAPRVGRRTGSGGSRPAAVAADEEAPSDDTRSDDAVEASSRRRRFDPARLVLVAVAVAAVVFGAVFGYRGVAEWRQTHGVDAAHDKAAEAAASAAETIFTYRYDRLEQYLDDSRDVMTPSFAKDFETISPALQDLAPQRKIQVQATTRDSAALTCGDDCSRDTAKVLVFVDQARLADGSQVPTVFGNRVEMTMVDRNGRWLVDDIKAL